MEKYAAGPATTHRTALGTPRRFPREAQRAGTRHVAQHRACRSRSPAGLFVGEHLHPRLPVPVLRRHRIGPLKRQRQHPPVRAIPSFWLVEIAEGVDSSLTRRHHHVPSFNALEAQNKGANPWTIVPSLAWARRSRPLPCTARTHPVPWRFGEPAVEPSCCGFLKNSSTAPSRWKAAQVPIIGGARLRQLRRGIRRRRAWRRSWRRRRGRYAQRKWLSEAPNGWIKETLGFRRFSLRGLNKARGEWHLVCLALNVKRLQGA